MTVSLIILGALFFVGVILYVQHRLSGGDDVTSTEVPEASETSNDDAECCGMHITCEKDSLLASVSDEVVYYDDEELDAYRGRESNGYTDNEIEEFRDVLLTLIPTDIAGWARSLQLRGINLPDDVRDELLMIVSETRQSMAG